MIGNLVRQITIFGLIVPLAVICMFPDRKAYRSKVHFKLFLSARTVCQISFVRRRILYLTVCSSLCSIVAKVKFDSISECLFKF
jgi:hypothetical protein